VGEPLEGIIGGLTGELGQNTSKVPEGIFQTPDKTLGGLAPNHFSLALARMTQHPAKQMRPTPLPVHQNSGTLPKIHLQLLARSAFHPAKGRLRPERQSAHEAFDRIISTGERVPGDQVLIDALSRKSRQQTLFDHSGQRGTFAGSPRIGPGGTLAGFDFEVFGCK
jgi:hypothetical protein